MASDAARRGSLVLCGQACTECLPVYRAEYLSAGRVERATDLLCRCELTANTMVSDGDLKDGASADVSTAAAVAATAAAADTKTVAAIEPKTADAISEGLASAPWIRQSNKRSREESKLP